MTELKVKCSACGHLQILVDYDKHTFTIQANENEAFENWLKEHDRQIRADAINDFVKAYTKFMDEDEKCNIYEECYDSPTGYCIDCFKEKWLKGQK